MSYPASIDTFTPLVNDPGGDEADADQINVIYTAVTAVQTELGTDPAGTLTDVKTRLAVSLTGAGYLAFQAATGLTITGGAITVSRNVHTIDTEGAGASDDLDTINGGATGFLIFLRTTASGRDVVIKHNTGNIYCAEGADFTLSDVTQFAYGYYDGGASKWMLARSIGAGSLTAAAGTAGQIPFYSGATSLTSDDDFTYSTAAGLVGNETGTATADLRWEGDTRDKLLFVDASAEKVQLGDPTGGNYVEVDASANCAMVISTLNAVPLTLGKGSAGIDYQLKFDGQDNDGYITWMEDEQEWLFTGVLKSTLTNYRRYYHIPLYDSSPGGVGPTWTVPSANTLGGFQLDDAGEILYMQTDMHGDWDSASDPKLEVTWEVNVNNTGGGAGDTVDLKVVFWYKEASGTACRTQTVEVATTVGQSPQYRRYTTTFTLDHDLAANVLVIGDRISMTLNLETDTSEVDNVIINDVSFYYNTTHIGIHSGDV